MPSPCECYWPALWAGWLWPGWPWDGWPTTGLWHCAPTWFLFGSSLTYGRSPGRGFILLLSPHECSQCLVVVLNHYWLPTVWWINSWFGSSLGSLQWAYDTYLFRPYNNSMGHLLPCAIVYQRNHPPIHLQWVGILSRAMLFQWGLANPVRQLSVAPASVWKTILSRKYRATEISPWSRIFAFTDTQEL